MGLLGVVVGLGFADLGVVVVLGFGWWSGSPELLILILVLILIDFGVVNFGCWVCCLQLGGVVVVAGSGSPKWRNEEEKRNEEREKKVKIK